MTQVRGEGAKLWKIGAPGTIRTSDPQIRSLMLYPAELRARIGGGLIEAGARARKCVARR